MAFKDPFVNFFKKRKEEAEENLRKVAEFKRKFIEEPLREIPQRANEDLFKAVKAAKKVGKKYIDTARKIREFEEKHFIKPISNIPIMPEEGAFKAGRTPISKYVPLGEYLKPESYLGGKAGKSIAATAEQTFGGMFMGLPGATTRIPAGAQITKEALASSMAKGAGLYAGVTAGLRTLRGEQIKSEELTTSGVIGAAIGFLMPTPLKGIKPTKLGAAQRRLAKYGFKPGDSPTALRRNLAKTKHPDLFTDLIEKAKATEEFKAINRDVEIITSAKAPDWALATPEGFKNWVRGLWRKKTERTGKEIVSVKGVGGIEPLTQEANIFKVGDIVKTEKGEGQVLQSWFNSEGVPFARVQDSITRKVKTIQTDQPITHKPTGKEIVPVKSPVERILSISVEENKVAISELKSKHKAIEQRDVPVNLIRNFPSPEGRSIIETAKKEIQAGKRYPVILEYIIEGENAGKYRVLDGNYRTEAYKELGITEVPAITQVREEIISAPTITPEVTKPPTEAIIPPTGIPRVTIPKLEKQITEERFTSFVKEAKTPEDYVKRIGAITTQLDRPEVRANKPKIRQIRAMLQKQVSDMTGQKEVHWKQARAQLELMRGDPDLEKPIDALLESISKMDEAIGSRQIKKEFEIVEQEANLPLKGKEYIQVSKYTTRGTRNREWIQTVNPMVYMGNKRSMVGAILDVLGIEQRDLGNLAPTDVEHLTEVKNVVDVFGGSGLLTNLSQKFFPNAKLTYNELNPDVVKAVKTAMENPNVVKGYVAMVGKYLQDNPRADWLSHFSHVYRDDPNFRVAASFLDMAGGRTGELTLGNITNLLKAIPNYSKVLQGVEITNKDAWRIIDKYIRSGTSKDFLWIDPPYLKATGYGIGTEMAQPEGFIKLLNKLNKLKEKGVNFVFFNNDPNNLVLRNKLSSIHLNNIIGNINKLSKEGITAIFDIKPSGVTRRELILTNLKYGIKINRLRRLDEVIKAIENLDPKTAERELLTLLRNVRESSSFIKGVKRISLSQIKRIRALRSRLRIRNREMIPVLDELLGDTSFARMTKEDGIRMIEWLQPRNWDVIENKIAQTREMLAEEKRQAAIGDRFVAKDQVLEDEFKAISVINEVIGDIDSLGRLMGMLPPVTSEKPGVISKLMSIPSMIVAGEPITAEMLKLDVTFHAPLLSILKISGKHQNAFDQLVKSFKDLSGEERNALMNRQAGVKVQGMSEKALARAKYVQDFAMKVADLIIRLQKAAGDEPMRPRDPYWPYIINQNLLEAAGLPEYHKPLEMRLSTPEDFQKGVFSMDYERVIEMWSQSSSSLLRKLLFKVYLKDRFDSLLRVGDPFQRFFVKTAVQFDIMGTLPDWEYALRAAGAEVNKVFGRILPKKVELTEPQKEFLSNSSSPELRELAQKGSFEEPRVSIPNVGGVYSYAFITAKLFSNFLFLAKNLTQQFQALPFVGITGYLEGLGKWVNLLLPQNKVAQQNMIKVMRDSGYRFGQMAYATELPSAKQKLVQVLTDIAKWTNSVSEHFNRTLNDQQEIAYNRRKGLKIPEEQVQRVGAEFSTFINYLSGKGRSPFLQRTTLGKPVFIFMQYPVNTMWKIWQMLKYALSDKYVVRTRQRMAASSYSPEAYQEYENMPPDSKARFFLVPLCFVLAAGTIKLITDSWRAATDTLPGAPSITEDQIIASFINFTNNPSEESFTDLKKEIKNLWSVAFINRLMAAYDINKYGMVTSTSGRPTFIEPTAENVWRTAIWGKGVLEEYEKAYPSILGRFLGGYKEAGEVEKLRGEAFKRQEEERKEAVKLLKLIQSNAPTDEVIAEFIKLRNAGKLTDSLKKKVKDYLKEQARGVGPLERSIVGLPDKEQAKFIMDKINSNLSTEELIKLLAEYQRQGILTPNVKDEMKNLLKEQTGQPMFAP